MAREQTKSPLTQISPLQWISCGRSGQTLWQQDRIMLQASSALAPSQHSLGMLHIWGSTAEIPGQVVGWMAEGWLPNMPHQRITPTSPTLTEILIWDWFLAGLAGFNKALGGFQSS